jgi:hypothetical protein
MTSLLKEREARNQPTTISLLAYSPLSPRWTLLKKQIAEVELEGEEDDAPILTICSVRGISWLRVCLSCSLHHDIGQSPNLKPVTATNPGFLA